MPQPSNENYPDTMPEGFGHVCDVLGVAERCWDVGEMMVAEFLQQPLPDVVTLVAFPKQPKELAYPNGKNCFQRLLISVEPETIDTFAAELAALAMRLYGQEQALPFGFILPPIGDVFAGTDKGFWYVAPPVYYPEDLALDTSGFPPSLYLWLLPVSASEKALIETKGSDAFETLLEEQDPDMTDIKRPLVA